jgi:hypothetical protein
MSQSLVQAVGYANSLALIMGPIERDGYCLAKPIPTERSVLLQFFTISLLLTLPCLLDFMKTSEFHYPGYIVPFLYQFDHIHTP